MRRKRERGKEEEKAQSKEILSGIVWELIFLPVQYVHVHETQLIEKHNPLVIGCKWLSGLVVNIVTQCAGRISANARPHQLRRGDRECGYYMPCTCNTDGWPSFFSHTAW